MIRLRIKISAIKPAIIKQITGSLKKGQIVVLPTDTIYGLSCLADKIGAIKRIYKLKGREAKKPLIVLVSSLAMAKKYALVSPWQEKFLKTIWLTGTRPTTVILKQRNLLPRELTGNSSGLALRLPKDKFLIKILKAVKKPLVSTSLNLSGQRNLISLKRLDDYFSLNQEHPDLIIDGGAGRRRRPSRLIDLREEGHPIVLRK